MRPSRPTLCGDVTKSTKKPQKHKFMQHIELTLHSDSDSLYPSANQSKDDRILKQLSYKPTNTKGYKTILYMTEFIDDIDFVAIKNGRNVLIDHNCPVTECNISLASQYNSPVDPRDVRSADMVILTNNDFSIVAKDELFSPLRRKEQIWVLLNWETPVHLHLHNPYGANPPVNWTLLYSPRATISQPYGKFYQLREGVDKIQQTRNYAANRKGRPVAVTSNCHTTNRREEYVEKLSQFIDVDIWGGCGKGRVKNISEVVQKYKFYLSFENSNCDTYITEKYFRRALGNDVLPIAMGAPMEYYKRISPPDSFLHVENFTGADMLAKYLHKLDQDDELYNRYFQWKGAWVRMHNMNLLCRLCAMAHAPLRHSEESLEYFRKHEKCRGPVIP